MALAQGTYWEVRTTGSDLNGGGFNSAAAGTDRSQQAAPHVVIDGAAITLTVDVVTSDVTLAGYVVTAADVGNIVNITGGTMTLGRYQIVGITVGNGWSLDRSAGVAAQTGTGRMGGCLASPGHAAGATVDANRVYVQAGTYLITSTTANISGGRISAQRGRWEGYQTTRGDLGAKPLFQASGINTFTIFQLGGNEVLVVNFEVDGALQAATQGFLCNARSGWIACTARNCTNSGFTFVNSAMLLLNCLATGCTTVPAFENSAGSATVTLLSCTAIGNTVTGFNLNAGDTATRCLSINNTGALSHGFVLNRTNTIQCVAYGNGGTGFTSGASVSNHLVNCIAEANASFGFDASVSGTAVSGEARITCAAFNNNGGGAQTQRSYLVDLGLITGTASFFTDPGTLDFSLNSDAGGGALLQDAGYPTTFPGTTTETNFDIGAAQGAGGGGGGGGDQNRPMLGQTWGGGA